MGKLPEPQAARGALQRFYQSKQEAFSWVKARHEGSEMAGPLLMSPSNEYFQQPAPLLIIGQETNGWEYVLDVAAQMKHYEGFGVGRTYLPSPFWNVTRKAEKALGNAAYSCAWTNLSKFDFKSGRSYGQYEKAISTLDGMLVEEISILNPAVCQFFTGPAFDQRLRCTFPGLAYEPVPGWSTRQLCQLVHAQLPAYSFRTYHPNFLRRRGLEKRFIDFLTSLPRAQADG